MSDGMGHEAAPAIYPRIAAVIRSPLWARSRFANSMAATLMTFSLLNGSMADGEWRYD